MVVTTVDRTWMQEIQDGKATKDYSETIDLLEAMVNQKGYE